MSNIGFTMRDLQDWTKAMFEQYGWMLLAKERGYNDKLRSYKKSVNRLDSAIREKLKSVEEENRRANISVLSKKVKLLKRYTNNI